MKNITGLVSNSFLIVKNYSLLSVKKEMFEILVEMERGNSSKDELYKAFNEIFEFLYYTPKMTRKQRKEFEELWYKFTWCKLEKDDIPDCECVVVIEKEIPEHPFYDNFYYKLAVSQYFKHIVPWKNHN